MLKPRRPSRPLSRPAATRILLIASTLLLLLGGCGPSDSIDDIRRRQASGDFAGTVEPLRTLLAQDRGNAEMNYLYGRALAATGQPGLAEWSLRKAMEDPEWVVPAGLQLAFGEVAARNWAPAIATTGRVLEADPENVEALVLRASAFTGSRMHHEEALTDVDKVLELEPDHLEVLRPRIHALLGLDRIDEAAAALEDLGARIEEARLGSDLPGWHCSISAIFLEESDELEQAAEQWAVCVEKYPTHGSVVRNGVTFYDSRGEAERSLEILRAAYQEAPESRSYRVLLTERLRAMGRGEESIAILSAATETDQAGNAAAAWIDLAKLLQGLERWQESADAALRAVQAVRSFGEPPPQLMFEYADALLLADRLDEARAVSEELTVPAHREMIRARVAQKDGDPVLALEHFEEAFRLWPDNPWARFHAAQAAEALGDFDRAIEEYRYVLRIAGNLIEARIRLARLLLADGRPREALQMLLLNASPGEVRLGPEGELVALELWGRLGPRGRLEEELARARRQAPGAYGEALAAAARGVAARAGAVRAMALLEAAVGEGLDVREPRNAVVLEERVRYGLADGRGGEVGAEIQAALAAHPEEPRFHAIRGLWEDGQGSDPAASRAAYQAALALDPDEPLALLGMGQLTLDADPEAALESFSRAAAADPGEGAAVRGEAAALVALGRSDEAERRLASFLAAHPSDAATAMRLARLQLDRGAASDRTLDLARRGARFARTPASYELLAEVHRARNEPELARRAATRAGSRTDPGGS